MLLYEKIADLCKERGLAISALETRCGLGNATIRGWKNSSPRVDSLKKVADYLGVTIEKLLEDEPEKEVV